jgi:methylated-DNA-[protein]-cysteine S-methyltransferase
MTNTAVPPITSTLLVGSPVGDIEMVADTEAVLTLRILPAPSKSPAETRSELCARSEFSGPANSVLDLAAAQLDAYFAGRLCGFTVPLRFNGSAFQRAIWHRLQFVPLAHTISYTDLGGDAGWPTAARAVGGAVRSNPLPIIVGCHRVVSATGNPTGYSHGNGLSTKRWLIEHERVNYSAADSSSIAPAN